MIACWRILPCELDKREIQIRLEALDHCIVLRLPHRLEQLHVSRGIKSCMSQLYCRNHLSIVTASDASTEEKTADERDEEDADNNE